MKSNPPPPAPPNGALEISEMVALTDVVARLDVIEKRLIAIESQRSKGGMDWHKVGMDDAEQGRYKPPRDQGSEAYAAYVEGHRDQVRYDDEQRAILARYRR